MCVHGVTKVIRDGNDGEALDFLIKRAGAGMEIAFSGGQTGSSCSWFDIANKEGERLVRETRVFDTKMTTATGLVLFFFLFCRAAGS
jgi:hypothetical protein